PRASEEARMTATTNPAGERGPQTRSRRPAWLTPGLLRDRTVLLLVLVVVLVVVVTVLDAMGLTSGRFTTDYLAAALIGYVPLALLALAELFVITSGRGGIDLSVGSMVSLTGVVFGMLFQ